MPNLTTDYLDKALKEQDKRLNKTIELSLQAQDERFQKKLNSLAGDLKSFVKEQDDELARLVNKGFEHTIKQLDVLERMARLEKVVYKIAEAIDLKVA